MRVLKVSKGEKIRNRYNQVPHLAQDTNGKVTNSQLDTTNESQEVSPFPAGDHKAHINRRAQRHSNHKTEQKHKRSKKNITILNVGQNIPGQNIPCHFLPPRTKHPASICHPGQNIPRCFCHPGHNIPCHFCHLEQNIPYSDCFFRVSLICDLHLL